MNYKNFDIENKIPNDDINIINEYIKLLRDNGIHSNLYIYDRKYFYSIFVEYGIDVLNNNSILEGIWNIDNKYRNLKSKNVHIEDAFSPKCKEDVLEYMSNEKMFDITHLFSDLNAVYSSENNIDILTQSMIELDSLMKDIIKLDIEVEDGIENIDFQMEGLNSNYEGSYYEYSIAA